MAALTRNEHTTYCPYKGDASYYSIPAGGDRSLNAVWTYENPFEAMAQIKDYVAFTQTVSTRLANRRRRPSFGGSGTLPAMETPNCLL